MPRQRTDSTPAAFCRLLSDFAEQKGTYQAAGEAIGISGSRYGRAVKGDYPCNTLTCLRLAAASGEAPGVVLRAAGHVEMAELIERLYGTDRPERWTDDDRALVGLWQKIPARLKPGLLSTLRAVAKR